MNTDSSELIHAGGFRAFIRRGFNRWHCVLAGLPANKFAPPKCTKSAFADWCALIHAGGFRAFIRRGFNRWHPCMMLIFIFLIHTSAVYAQSISDDRPKISGALSLQQAIESAMKNNLEILTMRMEADAAKHETGAARAMTRMQVSATTTVSTSDMEAIISSSPGVNPANSLMVPGKRGFADQTFSLMAPIYTGGRLENLVKAASKREGAARSNAEEMRLAVSLMVKDSYYRVLLAVEMMKTAQARLDSAKAMVDTAKAQFETGKGIQAAVYRAEAEMADAQRMLTGARNDRSKMLIDLKRAMGVRLDSDVQPSDTLPNSPLVYDLAGALKESATARPELAAARSRVESAKAQSAAARGSQKPQVYGTVMADVFAPAFDGGRITSATFGLTLSVPLYDAGQRRSEVSQMDSMVKRAEADLKNTEQRVAAEIRMAWLDIETAEQNIQTAQSALKSAVEAYEVTGLRVQNQKAILLEQLDAMAALTQARTNHAQALYDHSLAAAKLQRAVGRM